ncbi:hypothetical protein [Paraburkholderia sp. UCT31]|uniref:hypothetical protein n=1 Tax=Paraburkholderia sp. UCT31 TaxID=2615209 RepID=UPI001CA41527|nr:hypothetical protein [Paraburkholderia sp. UCT31]
MKVFVSYLIDPLARTIQKVRDGFDNAASLIGTDSLDCETLWSTPADPDSSVEVFAAEDGVLDEPWSRAFFRLRLTHDGTNLEKIFAGKAVLAAFGIVPDDLARQVATPTAVESGVEFLAESAAIEGLAEHSGATERRVVHWSEHAAFATGKAPARRTSRREEHPSGTGTRNAK